MSQDDETKLFQHAAVTVGALVVFVVLLVWWAFA